MQEIDNLVAVLSRLPGFGPRSAKRIVLQLLKKQDILMTPLINALKSAKNNVCDCEVCGNIDTKSPCDICNNLKRDKTTICVVENVADLWAMERTGTYKGKFHILGGVLSPIDGITPKHLNIDGIVSRIEQDSISEIILATNLTVEGQSTAHYLAEVLRPYKVKITRLANGIPVGGELDYLDDGTLAVALQARQIIE